MKAPSLSRGSSKVWIYGGLLAGGIYLLWKNAASAAAAPTGSPASVPYSPSSPAGGIAYTPAALNAAVPGVTFTPSTLQPGILTSTLTAVPAVTGAQVAAANSFWSTLSPVAPLDTGYITFPSGSQVAASLMGGGNTAMDASGNYFVLWAGQVYQLGSQDSSGNWPAMLVSGG